MGALTMPIPYRALASTFLQTGSTNRTQPDRRRMHLLFQASRDLEVSADPEATIHRASKASVSEFDKSFAALHSFPSVRSAATLSDLHMISVLSIFFLYRGISLPFNIHGILLQQTTGTLH